jgi:hypothetical protein
MNEYIVKRKINKLKILIMISRPNWNVNAASCANFSAHFQMARRRGGGPLIRMAKD